MKRDTRTKEKRRSDPQGALTPPFAKGDLPEETVVLGVLERPWGRHGEQTVKLYNPASDLLERADAVFVGGEDDAIDLVALRRARWVGKRFVVHLDGVETPEQAEAMRGLALSVDAQELPEIEGEGEYYVRDLLGLAVEDDTGAEMGTIADVFPTGGNDVYVVDGPQGESLIPATSEFVLEVDLEHRRMRVRRLEF